ncbi:MAG: hypothetical protein HOV66_19750 [Streptomycetaceae bacterium]|nr:hypothetical protein [Streptomycetaceae bacterium]
MSTATAFHLDAAPIIRCGHRETITLPLLGEVTARCWSHAAAGSDLCDRHGTARRAVRLLERLTIDTAPVPAQPHPGVEYLCPAPTSRLFRCLRPLPCTSHDVTEAETGRAVYGSVLLRTAGRRRPVRAQR